MRAVMAWGAKAVSQKPWLLLTGSVGTGKSTAGARALLLRAENQDQLGLYLRAPDLLGAVRDRIGDDEASVEELIEMYSTCPLLFVDDLGVQKDTDWTEEVIYRVLDTRYSEERDTIIATNVPAELMEARIADRLADPEVSEIVRFTWASYRSGERGG